MEPPNKKIFHTLNLHLGDFLIATDGMSAEQVGSYILLLVGHLQVGEKGLLDDDRQLAYRCRMGLARFRKNKDVILRNFRIEEIGNYRFWLLDYCIFQIKKMKDISEISRVKALKKHKPAIAAAKSQQAIGSAIQNTVSSIQDTGYCKEEANQFSEDVALEKKLDIDIIFAMAKHFEKHEMNIWFDGVEFVNGFLHVPTNKFNFFLDREDVLRKALQDKYLGLKKIE